MSLRNLQLQQQYDVDDVGCCCLMLTDAVDDMLSNITAECKGFEN